MNNYIQEFNKVIPTQICKKIIQYFENDFEDASTTGGMNKNVRNCLTRSILDPKTFGQRFVSNYVKSVFFNIAKTYQKKHSFFEFDQISQLDLLKYESNNYKVGYDFHKDFGLNCTERHISISVNLNNNFKGGEFVFNLNNELITYCQNEGDGLVFPSNFMFPHKVNQITEGTRYALIGWII